MAKTSNDERLRAELYAAVEERLRLVGAACMVNAASFSAVAFDGASLMIDGRPGRAFAKVTMSFPGQRPKVLTIRRCRRHDDLLNMADDNDQTVDTIAADIAAAFVRLFA